MVSTLDRSWKHAERRGGRIDHNTVRKLKSLSTSKVGGEARVLQLNLNGVWSHQQDKYKVGFVASLPQRVT